jgi:hypothetical protein
MKRKINWIQIVFVVGIIAIIVGVIDALEGSVIIALGNILIVYSTFKMRDRFRFLFFSSLAMIVFGIFFLFYFSSRGGFGGNSSLSWWWATFVLPYPLGWIFAMVVLLIRSLKRT